MLHQDVSARVLGSAIKVHTHLGPGLLESVYHACMAYELREQGLKARQEVRIPVHYGDVQLDCGFRADFIVEDAVLVELKAVDRLNEIHEAQVLTYLKLTGLRVGLLINFNAPTIPKGLRRLVR